jgi:TRAP-type transport system periplasmic protein
MWRRAFLVCGVCGLGLAGCFSGPDKIELLVRHNAPAEQPMHRALLLVRESLKSRSDGRISLLVEGLKSIPNHIDIVAESDHDVAMVSMAGLAAYSPPLAAFEAPYMFRDVEHFYKTVGGPIGRELLGEAERRSGLHVIDVWHQGLRQVTLRDTPASTPAEFGRIKLRVPGSTMFVEAARALGALPTTMSFGNVYVALRSGIVDGQENPLPTIRAMRFNEVCKYLVLTGHMVGTIVPVIGARLWMALSEGDRGIISAAFAEGGLGNRGIIAVEEERLVSEMAAGGMVVLRPDVEPFRRRAAQSWNRFQEIWGDSLVDRIQRVR